jgi:hypothetical protein
MSTLSPSRYRPTPTVIGALPRTDERPWFLRPALHYARVALAAGLGAGVALAMLAGLVHTRTVRAIETPRTERAVVKRALPEGMSSKSVVKWVPFRQASGRTELAPWTSVDAQLAQDPSVLQRLLKPAPEQAVAPDAADGQPGLTAPQAEAPKAASVAPGEKPAAAAAPNVPVHRETPSPAAPPVPPRDTKDANPPAQRPAPVAPSSPVSRSRLAGIDTIAPPPAGM